MISDMCTDSWKTFGYWELLIWLFEESNRAQEGTGETFLLRTLLRALPDPASCA